MNPPAILKGRAILLSRGILLNLQRKRLFRKATRKEMILLPDVMKLKRSLLPVKLTKTAKRLFLIPGMNLRNTMMRKKFQLGLEGSMCAKVLLLPAIRMKMKMVKTRILVRLLPQRKSLHARAAWFKEGLRLCLSAKRGLSVMQKSLHRLNAMPRLSAMTRLDAMHNQQKKMILTQKIPGLRRMK